MKRHSIFQRYHAVVLWLAVSLLTFHLPVLAQNASTDTTVSADTVIAKSIPMAAAATPTDPADLLNLSGTVSENQTYTSPEINSSQVITSGSVVYTAGDEIVLGPGFEVKGGATFEANVKDDFYKDVVMLTYNLHGLHAPGKTHGQYIKQFGADVVSVQEAYGPARFNAIKDASGLEGKICYTIGASYGIGMLWNPAVVGEPIQQDEEKIDTPDDAYDKKRAYMVAEFRYFCFVATHGSQNPKHRLEITAKILNNAIVKNCIAKGKPVYVAGDMNEFPYEGSMVVFKDKGFNILNDLDDPKHITHGDTNRIDLILEHNVKPNHRLIDRGIPLSEAERATWKDNVSDHFPYRVTVKIR